MKIFPTLDVYEDFNAHCLVAVFAGPLVNGHVRVNYEEIYLLPASPNAQFFWGLGLAALTFGAAGALLARYGVDTACTNPAGCICALEALSRADRADCAWAAVTPQATS